MERIANLCVPNQRRFQSVRCHQQRDSQWHDFQNEEDVTVNQPPTTKAALEGSFLYYTNLNSPNLSFTLPHARVLLQDSGQVDLPNIGSRSSVIFAIIYILQITIKSMTKKISCGESSGMVYILGFIGAVTYYISTAASFWVGVLGFLKALVWPGFLVYELLKFLGS